MKKNIFKKVAIFGACLCAPLMLTGCDQSESKTDFRVHNGFIQSTTDGTNWKNLVPLEDLKGVDGTNSVEIGADGYWYINGENTGVKARGEDGTNGSNGSNGLNGEDGRGISSVDITYSDEYRTTYTITYTDGSTYSFDVYNGQNGSDGNDGQDGEDGRGIQSVEITYSDGIRTTYTITFDDNTTYSFDVYNGTNGEDGKDGNGILSIEIDTESSDENKTVYVINFDNGSSYYFEVYHGQDGSNGTNGKDGSVVTIGSDGYWYIDGEKTDVKAKGEDGTNGTNGTNGKDGNGIKSITIDQNKSDETKTTYIITFDDNTTYSFKVLNGQDGSNGTNGKDGSVVTIGPDGYWYIDGEKTDVKAKGEDGTNGTNGTNGKDGNGIKSITIDQNKSDETKTTYIITFDDNTTYSFKVLNGQDGSNGTNGKDGSVVTIGPDGYWYIDGEKTDVKAKGEDGTNGVDASYATYTITYDYGVADTFFAEAKTTDTIKTTEWVKDLPTINSEYEESFLGWFVAGTDKKIENYDFIGGDVTLEARFDVEIAPSGVYTNGKYTKTWASVIESYPEAFATSNTIQGLRENGYSYFSNLSGATLVIDQSITTIGEKAFYGSNISQCVIPNGVLVIEEATFDDSSLETIILPNSIVEIGDYAFSGCTRLKNIKLPNRLKNIGDGAFSNCTSLTNITLNESIESIGAGAFKNCTSLRFTTTDYDGNAGKGLKYLGSKDNDYFALVEIEDKTLTSCILNDSTRLIVDSAFMSFVNLKNIDIPDSVYYIGEGAFRNSGIKSIHLPDNLREIRSYTFAYTSLNESITIPNNVEKIGYFAFHCVKSDKIFIPSSVESIDNTAFLDTANLYEIKVDEGNQHYIVKDHTLFNIDETILIRQCPYGGYEDDSWNAEYIIPSTVQTIAAGAFYGSYRSSIVIPSSVEEIEMYAFSHLKNIEVIEIPSSITTMHEYAFSSCNATTVIINSTSLANSIYNNANNPGWYLLYNANAVYIKSGLEVSNSTYLLENFTKQTTSNKDGYDMYVRNT